MGTRGWRFSSPARNAYLGAGGAVEGVTRGQVFADMSTTGGGGHPRGRRGERHRARASGAERARPVLSALGEVRVIGKLGSAASLKLIANTMLPGVYALAVELIAAGKAAGLSAEDSFYVANRAAPVLTQRKARFVERKYEPVTFAMRDILKDLELAAEKHMDSEMSAVGSLYENQPAGNKT